MTSTTYKDKKIPNRVHKVYKMNWAKGVITIHAIVDTYPAGNIVSYTMSVRADAELLERCNYMKLNEKVMIERINYFQSIPKEGTE